MSADSDLQNAYHEWQRLAEAEGKAICAGDWMRVSDCQRALQELQARIIRASDQACVEWARPGVDRAEKENKVRATVRSLIELEWRNQALLDVHRRDAQEEMNRLEEAGRTLMRVRRTYAPARPAAWTSFS
jgi:hypothetical protein